MKRLATVIATVALLVLPSAALASGSSTCQSYNQQLCQVASNTATAASPSTTTTGATTNASTLPFTGLDVGLLVVGGGVLLAAGLLVRRLSRGVQ
jgi:uncharacterized membrane protein YphA (DoxX/SURF4 family)